MNKARINGAELEYEVRGQGEPVLLISPVLADGFRPLLAQRDLAERYQLITYHRRGWAGSTHTSPPVSIADHARDAAALLECLKMPRAHVAGHSSGAAVALQLSLDRPEMVQSLILLEPSLFSVPSAQAFLEQAGPAFAAYENRDPAKALELFMNVVSGLSWEQCRSILEERIPGAIAQALQDADTFFGVELPALASWAFDAERAASIRQPTLSVLGARTKLLWVEVDQLLRASMPNVESRTIEGVGHLLHIEHPKPVAGAIASFLERHPMRAACDSNHRKDTYAATSESPHALGACSALLP